MKNISFKGFTQKAALHKHVITASGLPRITMLDHIPCVSKEIAPYHCVSCEQSFKRLSGLVIHNRYYKDKGRCPTPNNLEDLNLELIPHKANGNDYTVWQVKPSIKPTGLKDELLLQLEDIAFPKFNQTKEQS
jgi:hypothetical protein